jgi:hypothetical protein
VDRGLLVSGVNDAEVLICHYVQDGQDMIARQGENIFHAFELESLAD